MNIDTTRLDKTIADHVINAASRLMQKKHEFDNLHFKYEPREYDLNGGKHRFNLYDGNVLVSSVRFTKNDFVNCVVNDMYECAAWYKKQIEV